MSGPKGKGLLRCGAACLLALFLCAAGPVKAAQSSRMLVPVGHTVGIKLFARGGAGGKLFGSVSTKEIAEAIQRELGVELDKRKLSLDAEIKAFGTYTAEAKLYAGVSAKVYVVVSEEP